MVIGLSGVKSVCYHTSDNNYWTHTQQESDLFITCMITDLIKTTTKFSNVIGYHQTDLNTNRTVYMSCS